VHLDPQVGHRAPERLDQAQLAQGLERLDGVREVLAAVVDAAEAGPGQHVVGQDLVPDLLDRLHLGEEAVPADVEAEAVALG
jgi:hypothetical protein